MSNQNEVERIKRIREQQIAARDPTKKEKQLQQNIAQKYRRAKSQEKPVKDAWDALSNVWKGMIFGTILGFILMMAIPFIIGGRTAWTGLHADHDRIGHGDRLIDAVA